ncbi:hypothetical protein BGZ70_000691 [Mortierella alpina]|uniref:DNL-type domain-containing protein n=1 Tax=Mortierella alpina TaxID=64518 RepID=A0A9P6IXB0_MORAP|nr:hypothetical protein BGZ70_000691 [Mortierella alpina]
MRPAARPLLASFRRLACSSSTSSTSSTALSSISCRYLSNHSNQTLAQPITHRPLVFHNLLRPYHVSLRTLDQRHSAAAVSPPCPTDSDTTAAAAASAKAAKQDHDHDHDHDHPPVDSLKQKTSHTDDEGHIQPQQQNPIPPNTDPKARMFIGFTCTVCNHRSHKTMSKHAYQHGVVIMQCDHCKNRHLMADHLGWFKTGGVTVEDLVKERGETVRKLTKSYQLVKDGEIVAAPSTGHEPTTITGSTTASKIEVKAKTKVQAKVKTEMTELEIALEKAAEGMLEWIPKDVLEQEQDRMKKSQELLDHSKKQD